MSFIDLMSDDNWTEADVLNRTEAIVRSNFSVAEEQILNRKVSASLLQQYVMTPQDLIDLSNFTQVATEAKQLGEDARIDVLLLNQIKHAEQLYRSVQLLEKDTPEYLALKAEIEQIPQNVLEWLLKRERVVLDIDYKPPLEEQNEVENE